MFYNKKRNIFLFGSVTLALFVSYLSIAGSAKVSADTSCSSPIATFQNISICGATYTDSSFSTMSLTAHGNNISSHTFSFQYCANDNTQPCSSPVPPVVYRWPGYYYNCSGDSVCRGIFDNAPELFINTISPSDNFAKGQSKACLSFADNLNSAANQTCRYLSNGNVQSIPIGIALNISSGVPSGTVTAGVAPWYNSKDKVMRTPTDTASNPFEFITPLIIYDKNTGEYYASDGGHGTYPSGGNTLLADGTYVYWPVGQDASSTNIVDTPDASGNCLGGLSVSYSSTGRQSNQVNLVPAYTVNHGNACYVGPTDNPTVVTTGINSHYSSNDSSALPYPVVDGASYKFANVDPIPNGSFSSAAVQMFGSLFAWTSQTTITTQNGSGDLSLINSNSSDANVVSAAQKYAASINPGQSSGSQWLIFTSPTCSSQDAGYPTVVAVDFTNDSSLSNTDIASAAGQQNSTGYFLVDNKNSAQRGYTGTGFPTQALNCLFGNTPGHDQDLFGKQLETNNNYYAVIDNIGCSVGNNCIAQPTGTAPNTGPSSGNGGAAGQPTCQSSGGPLSWLTCAVINGIQGVEKTIEGLIQQALKTGTIDFNPSDCHNKATSQNYTACVYSVWSNFRIYGNVVLVLALLVVIFGEAIGGGLIDAYTAKKMLPRILVAAILINLSIYIVAVLEDVTNVLGSGVYTIISEPFKQSGTFFINITSASGNLFGVAAVGGLLGVMAATGALWKVKGLADALGFLALMVGLPTLMAIIGVVITIFFRDALLVLLLMVSPIAFALYCLPNTEQYFKKWWGLLFKTLMVYPIVMVIFAMCDVGAVIVTSFVPAHEQWLGELLSIVAVAAPLFLVPFAFKMSGGVIGSMHGGITGLGKRASEAIKGSPNNPNSMRNRKRDKIGNKSAQIRERGVRWGMDDSGGKRFGAVGRIGRRTVARSLNYGNLQAGRATYNKQRSEIMEAQIATGDDTNIRDTLIAWDSSANNGKGGWFRRMDMDKDPVTGQVRAKTGAKAVYTNFATGQMAHNKAMKLYGGDKSSIQDALWYEWKKTSYDPGQMKSIEDQYGDILAENKFTNSEGTEMMKGVGFRHQGQSLSSKYSTFKPNAQGVWGWEVDHLGLSREVALNQGTYPMSNQDVRTYNELGRGYVAMSRVLGGDYPADENGTLSRADEIITNTGTEFDGKTRGQVYQALDRTRRIADAVNPKQRTPTGVSRQTISTEEGEHPVGYGGVSNAPADVQVAAQRFYDIVASDQASRRGNGNGGTPGPQTPGGGSRPTPPPPPGWRDSGTGSGLVIPHSQ